MSEINEIWKYVATTSLGVIISMLGFWFAVARNMVSRTEVVELLETKSPYLQDKQFIIERLTVNKETQAAFALALQRNTEVMNELRVQLATLGKTLEALEERVERYGDI